jgi:hypothetical protein
MLFAGCRKYDIACGQIGSPKVEPRMDPRHVGDAVVSIANLTLGTTVGDWVRFAKLVFHAARCLSNHRRSSLLICEAWRMGSKSGSLRRRASNSRWKLSGSAGGASRGRSMAVGFATCRGRGWSFSCAL